VTTRAAAGLRDDEPTFPERLRHGAGGVERVDGVVLRRDEDDVARPPPIVRPVTISGCAYTNPSTTRVKTRPNVDGLTFAGVSVVSRRFGQFAPGRCGR